MYNPEWWYKLIIFVIWSFVVFCYGAECGKMWTNNEDQEKE